MTTVLAVYNSDGCVGRCDKNCYDAVRPNCHCICGGVNHGQGLAQAVEHNKEQFGLRPEDLKRFADSHGFACEELRVVDRLRVPNRRSARKQAHEAIEKSRGQMEMFR
jgi:hypothetical protein